MGNMLLQGFVHRHGRRIKIMRADGTLMKLWSAVSMKEILIDYPNHGIFEAAPAGPDPLGIGMSFSRPLPEREVLGAGHLYYLFPLPLQYHEFIINPTNNGNRGHFERDSSKLQRQPSADHIGRDSIKQEQEDEKIDRHINVKEGVKIVSSVYSAYGSTVRVKVLLRKKDVASFLFDKRVNVLMGNVEVPPLIQRVSRQFPCKPRLDIITEPDSPLNADL